MERWRLPGPRGFWNWCQDIAPRVLTRSNRFEVFSPTETQAQVVEDVLTVNGDGSFKHSLSLLVWPRRHGKSTVFALVLLWLLTSRRNWTAQLLGNTADHTRRVMFKTLKRIITNTPKLAALIPETYIYSHEIQYPPLGNVIQMGEGVSLSTAFGDRLNLLWVSDFHAAVDLEPFNALQAALLDSADSLALIDSNVDTLDGHVHALEREAAQDQTIFCHRIEYRDLEHFEQEAPTWIDRAKARRLQRTALPAAFERDILGQRSDATNALFTSATIAACRSPYKAPVSDLKELTQGRAYKVGGGLDRSRSLLGGDNTVWTVVLKVAAPEVQDHEYFVLNQHVFKINHGPSIKKAILKDHERYGLSNVVLENYEVADLAPWLTDQNIPFELVSATDKAQNASFPEFARLAREGLFHFSADMKDLADEMGTFVYTVGRAGKYSFGHAQQKFHDDTVYSTNWAIYGLRESVLSAFVLGNLQCTSLSPNRRLCFLMGGDLELLCKDQCPAYHQVREMHREYHRLRMDDDLTLPAFMAQHVKVGGARIYQGV